jgi:hypothetical protein
MIKWRILIKRTKSKKKKKERRSNSKSNFLNI